MTPFEDLIKDLGMLMGIPLKVDPHLSCALAFPDGLNVQIDLGTNADKILVGTQLGFLSPGTYRERVLTQAMRVNGITHVLRGLLAYSDRKDTLVLFQFLPLTSLTPQKLHAFLDNFITHAWAWKEALSSGEVPSIEGDAPPPGSGFYGLKP